MVMGNCGVGIAPCRPEAREIAMRDLVNVEAIPFEVLDAGITWDWETFPQYMDAAARRKPSLNTSRVPSGDQLARNTGTPSASNKRWNGCAMLS